MKKRKIFVNFEVLINGRVAQMVEQWTENPRVGGSIPSPTTNYTYNPCKINDLQGFFISRHTLIIQKFKNISIFYEIIVNQFSCEKDNKHLIAFIFV